MIRQVAAVALVTCLTPVGSSTHRARACPGLRKLRINTQAAPIYRSPSTGSPVVGTARRGAWYFPRLGSWVRVSWPDAEEGAGYVHVSSAFSPCVGACVSHARPPPPCNAWHHPHHVLRRRAFLQLREPAREHATGTGARAVAPRTWSVLAANWLGRGLWRITDAPGRTAVSACSSISRSRITTVGTPEQVTMVQVRAEPALFAA